MSNCIVVGGGLVGMLSARALVKRGLKVTVLERGPFGQEASWAGGGILSSLYPWRHPDAVHQLISRSQQLYPELIDEIRTVSSVDSELRQSGMLMLGVDDIARARAWAQARKVVLKATEQNCTAKLEPVLSLSAITPVSAWMPDIAQIRNPRFVKAMQLYLQAQGVHMQANSEVAAIESRLGRVTGVSLVNGRFMAAEKVIVANGAWSAQLLQRAGINLYIRPVRGQMILLKGLPDMLQHIVLKDSHYLIPRADGHIVAGSTTEDVGFDKSVTDGAQKKLLNFIKALAPDIAELPFAGHWAGLRPGCGQGVPYITEHSDIQDLYINAGHFRNGIVMAPAAAELLSALCLKENAKLDPGPYRFEQKQDTVFNQL